MTIDLRTVKTIEKLLERELALYAEYLAVMGEEQLAVVSLKADLVSALSERRAEILDQLSSVRDQRVELVASLTGDANIRLSEYVEAACAPADKKRLAALINQIRATSKTVENKSKEFNQVLNFSLGLVNGEISILKSAAQPVTRVYDSFGTIRDGVQPNSARAGSLLGEA
ncbi:MAG: flagellar export chaperone FlgN [Pseudomonadota bacterium]|jgi:hypothetical protein